MKKAKPITEGMFVHVKQSSGHVGETLYKVMSVEGFACTIAEVRADGQGLYAAQRSDTSLLIESSHTPAIA